MTNTIPASRYTTIDEPPASSAESLIEGRAASVQKALKRNESAAGACGSLSVHVE
jgi:hypothetical protein